MDVLLYKWNNMEKLSHKMTKYGKMHMLGWFLARFWRFLHILIVKFAKQYFLN